MLSGKLSGIPTNGPVTAPNGSVLVCEIETPAAPPVTLNIISSKLSGGTEFTQIC